MVGNSALHVTSLPTSFSSYLMITLPGNSSSSIPLTIRRRIQINRIRVSSADAVHSQRPSCTSEAKNPLAAPLRIPQTLCRKTLRPLSAFRFGGRSMWEGGVGLFLVSGTVLFVFTLAWLSGFQIRSKFKKYIVKLEFARAFGISTGTPVRIRGVTVGNVIGVNSSLKCIEAVVQVGDDRAVIPRNSLIQVNQSGLIMETKIDITPLDPIPTPSVGPLDQDCAKEGLIVCDYEKIKGEQGSSLDALVDLLTRHGRELEKIGIINIYSLAERVYYFVEEVKPLLAQIKAMVEDFQPLLGEVHDSDLLKKVKNVIQNINQDSDDLRRILHSSIMTPDNAELVQEIINTLIVTLKNIQYISKDVVGFTGDETTTRNFKLLIKNLSRLL